MADHPQACPKEPAQWLRSRPWLAAVLAAVVVLALGLGVTVALWHNAQQQVAQKLATEFQGWADKVAYSIAYRLNSHVQILRGVIGLFDASETVSREEFRRYVSALNLAEHYPGIQGIGFSIFVPAAQKAAHIAAVRAEGFADYSIRPDGERSFYTAVLYLEPFSGRNLRAFGFDMSPEPVRWAAAARARDNGEAALSGKVILQQETGIDIQAGCVLFMPVYRSGMAHEDREQRRASLLGWVYSPLRMHDLMSSVLRTVEFDELRTVLNITLYDGEQRLPETLLFTLQPVAATAQARFQMMQQLRFGGHPWTMVVSSTAAFEARAQDTEALLIAVGGGLVSLLLAVLSGLLILNHRRTIASLRRTAELLSAREQAEQESARRENLLRKIIEILPVGLWIADKDGKLISANPVGRHIWGAQPQVGPASYGVFKARRLPSGEPIGADDWALLHTVREGVTVVDEMLEIETFDGQKRVILNYTAPVFDEQGALQAAIVVNHDISERKRAEAALHFTQAVVDRMSDAAFRALPNGRLVYANAAACQMLGYTLDELLALSIQDIIPDYDAGGLPARWHELRQVRTLRIESQHRCKDGTMIPVEIHLDYMGFEGEEYACALVHDISERLRMEAILREQVMRDPLTGLFNHRYLDETLPRELVRCQRSTEPLTVAMLDLDHFKDFNDSYGHEAGDAVLRAIGDLLQQSLRASDIACRYGGEELTLILPGAPLIDAWPRMEALRHAVADLQLRDRSGALPAITVSIGLAEATADIDTAAILLARADAALYQAKQQGRNRVVCAEI